MPLICNVTNIERSSAAYFRFIFLLPDEKQDDQSFIILSDPAFEEVFTALHQGFLPEVSFPTPAGKMHD